MLQIQQEPGRQLPPHHPPADLVWLAVLSPLTASGQWRKVVDRVTATGHRDLPGELGNAHAVDVIGSGQKIATGHAESGLPENESVRVESGSGQKTATGHDATAHRKRATATMTASDALNLLTTNGKRSESKKDGHCHENYPTVNELSYPSVLLNPKIGNHGRITRRSGPPKPLSVPHVVERAVRNGERQPRK